MQDGSDRELLLGSLAVELGRISFEQLRAALDEQAQDKARFGFTRQVGTIFVLRGWLTQAQLMDLLLEQSNRRARRLRAPGP